MILLLALQGLVAQLGAEDYEVREAAMAALRERGPDELDALRPHLGSRDPEIAARVAVLVEEFELRRLLDLLDVKVDSEGLEFQVTVTNRSSRAVVLQRTAWRVWITYADGNFGGRYGGSRSNGCTLRDEDFLELAPGEARTVATAGIGRHEEVVSVSATYSYSRDAYVARCGRGCRHHDEPERPWNRAPEIELKGERSVGGEGE